MTVTDVNARQTFQSPPPPVCYQGASLYLGPCGELNVVGSSRGYPKGVLPFFVSPFSPIEVLIHFRALALQRPWDRILK